MAGIGAVRWPRGRVLAGADFCVSFICVPLLVCACWWGVWTTAELLLLPAGPLTSAWLSVATGAVAVYLHAIYRHHLQLQLQRSAAWWRRVVARLLLLPLTVGHVMLWRGVFLLNARTMDGAWRLQTVAAEVCILLLILLRSLGSALRAPLSVGIDSALYKLKTPLGAGPKQEFQIRSVDSVLTVLVTCLVACLWANVWHLMSPLLQQSSVVISAINSLGLGYFLSIGCYMAQFTVASRGQHGSSLLAFCIHTVFLISAFLGVLNIWRGYFLLADVLFYHTSGIGSSVVKRCLMTAGCAVLSAGVLMTFGMSKNLLLDGATRDRCGIVSFSTHCVTQLLQAKQDDNSGSTATLRCRKRNRNNSTTDNKIETLI